MVDGCTGFQPVVSRDTCADIAADVVISLTDFVSWNPGVGSNCSGLCLGYNVCIMAESDSSLSSSTSSTATTTRTTTTTTTLTSTRNDDCDEFYLVVSDDTSADIVFRNPTVGTDCSGLWLEYYVCVGIL
ncbi:hypothetical protein BDV09DRAFT_186601 [Aspergillus tetrazonus]